MRGYLEGDLLQWDGLKHLYSRTISTYVRCELRDRIDTAAQRQGVTRSEWVRAAIEQALERDGD